MEIINEYLESLENDKQKELYSNIITEITNNYPQLQLISKYNLPTFVNNDCFIFSVSMFKKYYTLLVEKPTLDYFIDDIKNLNYEMTKTTIKVKYDQLLDYELLFKMIDFQIKLREGSTNFWY